MRSTIAQKMSGRWLLELSAHLTMKRVIAFVFTANTVVLVCVQDVETRVALCFFVRNTTRKFAPEFRVWVAAIVVSTVVESASSVKPFLETVFGVSRLFKQFLTGFAHLKIHWSVFLDTCFKAIQRDF